MDKVNWGIIGCGDVTEVKSGPGLQNAKNSCLKAVMRRNSDLAQDYAERHGVPCWYDDADDLINDPEVNAIYVATPPAFHKEYTIKSAETGKPVYVEKPMALNYKECKEMIDSCKKQGVNLYVAYYRRALPRFNKIKELIDDGAIGDIRFVNVVLYQKPAIAELEEGNLPWRVIPEIAGGGIFLDLASHTLDFLDYFLGPITEVEGLASNQADLYAAEDMVTANFRFETGVQGTGTWCFTAFENYDMNVIVGEKGKIEFSSFGEEPIVLTTGNDVSRFNIKNPTHVQQPLIQTVVNDLLNSGTCPSTGESGARTSKVMDQILEDYYNN